MSQTYLTRAQVRDLDRRAIEELGIPGIVLMENAGRGAAETLLQLGVQGPVVICCGKGNNGGDGFVIARHLDIHQIGVRILLFAQPEEIRGDAAIAYKIAARSGLPIEISTKADLRIDQLGQELAAADWVVDALFGTGLSGPVRPPFDRVIAAINANKASNAKVLAVDIPSGLDCDTGQPLGPTIKADHTVTFVALKKGFVEPTASSWLGHVHVVGIGAPRLLWMATRLVSPP